MRLIFNPLSIVLFCVVTYALDCFSGYCRVPFNFGYAVAFGIGWQYFWPLVKPGRM